MSVFASEQSRPNDENLTPRPVILLSRRKSNQQEHLAGHLITFHV